MASGILQACGGLGLFLLGMTVLTQALKSVAGGALHLALSRRIRGPFSGTLVGAGATAVLQSSSATTVAALGAVSAGLLTFPQALGIVFGANLGTTATGWLVAIFGFKLELKAVMGPLVFVGVLASMLGKGRLRQAGLALAAGALVFVGIAQMQQGMGVLKDLVSPDSFPPDTWLGRLLLILMGTAMTLVTQSSSAGVAMALAALHGGAISFAQAAALVIGFDVGSTVTSLIAGIGTTVPARRVAWSHVWFNVVTAGAGYLLLPFYVPFATGFGDVKLGLVAFHSLFNIIGLIVVLPLANPFARMVCWLVPDRRPGLIRRLDHLLLSDPMAASTAALNSTRDVTAWVLGSLVAGLTGAPRDQWLEDQRKAAESLAEIRSYLDQLGIPLEMERAHFQQISALYVMDHLVRIMERCEEDEAEVPGFLAQREIFDAEVAELVAAIEAVVQWLESGEGPGPLQRMEELSQRLTDGRRDVRTPILQRSAAGELTIDQALYRLDALRWLYRMAYHIWRIVYHLSGEQGPAAPEGSAP